MERTIGQLLPGNHAVAAGECTGRTVVGQQCEADDLGGAFGDGLNALVVIEVCGREAGAAELTLMAVSRSR